MLESYFHRRNLRKIPIRILVNGTRGKSSVTRLIAGALRESGYRTIAKATGSEARIILEDGSETPVNRRLGPRITEQEALAKLAAARRADALVVECMAVRAESQSVMRNQLVRPTLTVITNVRVDHIEEMGRTEEDTAAALSFSIPLEGTLVTTDPRFASTAKKVVLVGTEGITPEILTRFSYPVFPENVALALRVAGELGIDRETALRGMAGAAPDIGVMSLFKLETPSFRVVFINGFAANDVLSTSMVWEKASEKVPAGMPLVLLFNSREDREYRIAEFLSLPRKIGKIRLLAVTGGHAAKVARAFSKTGLESVTYAPGTGCEEMLAHLALRAGGPFVLFGIGNIQGMGKNLLAYFAEKGIEYDWSKGGECFRNR